MYKVSESSQPDLGIILQAMILLFAGGVMWMLQTQNEQFPLPRLGAVMSTSMFLLFAYQKSLLGGRSNGWAYAHMMTFVICFFIFLYGLSPFVSPALCCLLTVGGITGIEWLASREYSGNNLTLVLLPAIYLLLRKKFPHTWDVCQIEWISPNTKSWWRLHLAFFVLPLIIVLSLWAGLKAALGAVLFPFVYSAVSAECALCYSKWKRRTRVTIKHY